QRNGARAGDFGGRGSRGARDVRFSFAATFLCRIDHATALGGTTFDSASAGKCRAARGLDFGQPGGATARAILFAAVARSRGRAGMGIGERWALALMLRLRLLECLRALAIQVEQQQSQSEEADFWANRLITGVRHSSARLLKMLEELMERHPEPTAHFASELMV